MRINDQSIGIGEVVPPQGPQFLLAADIPHSEHYILVLNLLNIETDGRDGGENFANVQLIEYGGFSSCIQPKHHHLKATERVSYQMRGQLNKGGGTNLKV